MVEISEEEYSELIKYHTIRRREHRKKFHFFPF